MSTFISKHRVRFFISSTFVDMSYERDVINNEVVGRLRETFSKSGADIECADLRWGINTLDEGTLQKRRETIINVCLDEINACKPYFIVVLGSRIGWIPERELIENCYGEQVYAGCRDFFGVGYVSMTMLEIYNALVLHREDFSHIVVCARNADSVQDIPLPFRDQYVESERQKDCEHIREVIRKSLEEAGMGDSYLTYTPEWGDNRWRNLGGLSDRLTDRLTALMKGTIASFPVFRNRLEEIAAAQEQYIGTTCFRTLKREGIENELLTNLHGNNIVFLKGESGTGKSTTLCRIHNLLQLNKDLEVLWYSSRVGMGSNTYISLLQVLCMRLSYLLGKEYEPEGGDNELSNMSSSQWYNSLGIMMRKATPQTGDKESFSQTLRERLVRLAEEFMTASGKRLVMIIDDLDGLMWDEELSNLKWLDFVPFAVLAGECDNLHSWIEAIAPLRLKVVNMPPIERNEAWEILGLERRKSLPLDLRSHILNKRRGNGTSAFESILWLKTMVQSLVSMNIFDYEKISHRPEEDGELRIRNYLMEAVDEFPATAEEALLALVNKLGGYIDIDFCLQILGYLAFSDYGLTEDDLSQLTGDKWSPADFAVLRYWLGPYIQRGIDNQWHLASPVLVNAISFVVKEQRPFYSKLLALCLSKPMDSRIRVYKGMRYAIMADEDGLNNAMRFFCYQCRIPPSVHYAVNELVQFLATHPVFLDRLFELNELEQKDVTSGEMSLNATSIERLVCNLGDALYKEGYSELATRLFETQTDLLKRLKQCPNWNGFFGDGLIEFADFRLGTLRKEKGQWRSEAEKDDATLSDAPKDVKEEIYDAVFKVLHEDFPDYSILRSKRFYLYQEEGDWADITVHTMAEMLGCITCDKDDADYSFWKSVFLDDVKLCHMIADYFSDKQIEETRQSFMACGMDLYYRLNTAAQLIEIICEKLPDDMYDLERRLLDIAIGVYTLGAEVFKTETAYAECATGYQRAGGLMSRRGDPDRRAEHFYELSLQYARKSVELYPMSSRSTIQLAYKEHSAAMYYYNHANYQRAYEGNLRYFKTIERVLSQDDNRDDIRVSYCDGLKDLGNCCYMLDRYEEAFDYFVTLIDFVNKNLKQVNSAYGFVRIKNIYYEGAYGFSRTQYALGNVDGAKETISAVIKAIENDESPALDELREDAADFYNMIDSGRR